MIVYDITIDGEPPFGDPTGRLIRCVYDHNGIISALTGMHLNNGVNLLLRARQNVSTETWTNPIHHHISILSRNPRPYAEKFNTQRFVLEYRRRDKESFLKDRFPDWNVIGYSDENYPMMELVV